MTRRAPDDVREEDLLRYVDDSLTPQRRAAVKAHLDTHPDVAARVAADLAQRDRMRAAFTRLSQASMPAAIDLGSVRAKRRRNRTATLKRAAAVLLIALSGGIAGWMLKPGTAPLTPPMQQFLSEALNAHRTYVVEVAHPVEVTADRQAHLSTWLTKRLGRPIRMPDLRAAGLDLVGGRLLPSSDGPAAQLMYEKRDGERVTLYLRAENAGEVQFRLAETLDGAAFYWSDRTFAYAIAGPFDADRLLDIAHLVQAQLAAADGKDL